MTPQQGITAIRAYMNGEWDNPELEKIGILHLETEQVIDQILEYVIDEPDSGAIEHAIQFLQSDIHFTSQGAITEAHEIATKLKQTLPEIDTYDRREGDTHKSDEEKAMDKEWYALGGREHDKEEPEEKYYKGNTAYLERNADSDSDNSYEDDY